MIEKNIRMLDDIIDTSSLLSRDSLIEMLTNDDKRFEVVKKIDLNIQNLLNNRYAVCVGDTTQSSTDELVGKLLDETLQNQTKTLNKIIRIICVLNEDEKKVITDILREKVENE